MILVNMIVFNSFYYIEIVFNEKILFLDLHWNEYEASTSKQSFYHDNENVNISLHQNKTNTWNSKGTN